MRKESQNLKSRDKETEVDRTIGKSGFKRERDQDIKIHWDVWGGDPRNVEITGYQR